MPDVARKLSAAIAQCAVVIRRFSVAVSVAEVMRWAPRADREHLARHLSRASDPYGRALYLAQQVRRGHVPPLLS